MNLYLFFSITGVFAIAYLFISKKISSKTKSCEDYFLTKKKLSAFSLALTLLATQLGGGALLGAADAAYANGWTVLFYPMGMSLGLIALSLGFGKSLKKLKIKTVVEIFEKKYGSLKLRKFASLLSIVTLFFILVSQCIAARKFFVAIGFDNTYLFLIFWLVVVLYTTYGGLKGVVYADMIKMVFTILVMAFIFFLTSSSMPDVSLKAVTFISQKNSFWVSWFLMPLLFMVIEQDMGQRCFAAKSSKSITWGGIIAAVLLFLASSFAIYFGILAKKMGLVIAKEGVLMTSVSSLCSPYITSIFAVAILMVIISTADSLLCSIASNVAFDFPLFKGEKKKLYFSRISTFSLGMLAVIVSFSFTNVLSLLIKSYELSVSILFVPIAMAIFSEKFSKNFSKEACISSMALGGASFLFFEFFKAPIPKEIISLSLSFLAFFQVEYLKRRREKALKA